MNAYRQARLRAGLKQCWLADQVGVSRSFLCMVEKGQRSPSAEVARKIRQEIRAADDVRDTLYFLKPL